MRFRKFSEGNYRITPENKETRVLANVNYL